MRPESLYILINVTYIKPIEAKWEVNMKTERNPKGAGRKKVPYRTKVMRIPEPLEVEVKKLIEDFKNANQ